MKELCPLGAQLQERAATADQVFKSQLIDFLSNSRKDDGQKRQLEMLGVQQREADEIFSRHKRLCGICAEVFFAA